MIQDRGPPKLAPLVKNTWTEILDLFWENVISPHGRTRTMSVSGMRVLCRTGQF